VADEQLSVRQSVRRLNEGPWITRAGRARWESWLGLSEQVFRIDRWRVCRVQAAAICGSLVK
jgi:hypothetical protein